MLKRLRNCVQVFLLEWRTDKANDNFKKINRMKKFITLMILSAICLGAKAQYLPNVGFSEWKGDGNCGQSLQSSSKNVMGTIGGYAKRPGDEPSDWNGSSVNQTVASTNKSEKLIFRNTDDTNIYANLVNTWVGALGVGSNAPAYLTFGTPWVYAVTTISKCDGGTFGGMSFSAKPDAIKGRFKKTYASNREDSYVVAYIWNGTFKSNITASSKFKDNPMSDVDRAILGSVPGTGVAAPSTVTETGKLIAWCNSTLEGNSQFDSGKASEWQELEFPLNYVDANIEETPSMTNVIICAGDYWSRDNLQNGTTLGVDDVDYVYWNTLSSLKYNNIELIQGPEIKYHVDTLYESEKLSATPKSQFASVSKEYNNETGVLTVTVSRPNAEDKTYTIQFYNASATLAVNSAAQYGTFCAPFDVTIPEDVQAFTIDGIAENGKLTLVEQQSTIPAHTPVIVYSESTSDINAVQFGVATSGTATSDYLKGVYTDTTAPVGSYVLQNQSGRVGFYQVQEGIQPMVRANRAYLTVPGPANVKAFYMDDATAIQTVEELLSGMAEIYDLAGRRQQKLQKGINIVGGKKVLVK